MTSRKKTTTVAVPSCEARANPDAVIIISQRDWRESRMPAQVPRHAECRRNEVFMMNVTPQEFAWFSTLKMEDFKRVRLGELAFTSAGKLLDVGIYRPMFGALKRGARLRRKEKTKTKKRKA